MKSRRPSAGSAATTVDWAGAHKLSKALAGTRRFTPLELALIAEEGGTSTDCSGRRPGRGAR